MKKILFLLILLSASVSVAFASDVNAKDTVVIDNPGSVTIVTSDSLQLIRVDGSKDDPNYSYQSKIQLTDSNYVSESGISSDNFEFHFGLPKKTNQNHAGQFSWTMNYYIGFATLPGLPQPAELQGIKSYEVGIIPFNIQYSPWKSGKHSFSVGIGGSGRSYYLSRAYRWDKTDHKLSFGQYPEGSRKHSSHLDILSVTVPVLYNLLPDTKGLLSIGPIFNFNVKSKISTKWKDDGVKYKETADNLHVRPFTVDFLVALRTDFFGVYLKYSPMNVMKSSQNLKFHSLSFGLWF